MTRKQLSAAIKRILADEKAYAKRTSEGGEFGRAKLIFAAIGEIEAALRSVKETPDDAWADALEMALGERLQQYRYDWDDEDGNGTSTFTRVIDQLEAERG